MSHCSHLITSVTDLHTDLMLPVRAGCMGALRVSACPVPGVTPLMMGVATALAPGREGAGWARMGRVLRAGRTLGGVDTGGWAEGRTTAAAPEYNGLGEMRSEKLNLVICIQSNILNVAHL